MQLLFCQDSCHHSVMVSVHAQPRQSTLSQVKPSSVASIGDNVCFRILKYSQYTTTKRSGNTQNSNHHLFITSDKGGGKCDCPRCLSVWARLLRNACMDFDEMLRVAKRLFYKAVNRVFGKIGRIASEEVTLQLVKSKCIPILLYGLEVCELSESQMASLDFTINRFFYEALQHLQ